MTFNQSAPEQTSVAQSSIRLVDVCYYYDPITYPHQKNAIDWLQHQINSSVLLELYFRWNNHYGRRFPTLQEGDRGESVTELQRLLNKWESILIIDGIFGRRTHFAVNQFQSQRGLVVDGIVGNRTWGELIKPAHPMHLSELFRSYNPGRFPAHETSLNWMQGKLSSTLLHEFARRWRNQVR